MSNFPLLTIAFGLSAALAWGSGDFSGGTAARRAGPFQTVLVSYLIGLALLVIAAAATQESAASLQDLLWGALAGLAGMVGLGFLLGGFAAGRMGIIAPLSATLATALPVVFTAFTEGLPRELQLVGFGLALTGIWLLTRPEALGGRPAGLLYAVIAGAGFGAFFIALDQVSEGAVFWPLVAGRAACCAVLLAYALARRRPVVAQGSPIGIMALAGVLDVSGNLFFLLAVQSGRLDVATVLASLYPAVTTLLAWLLAGERMARHQATGVAAAVLAIVFISL